MNRAPSPTIGRPIGLASESRGLPSVVPTLKRIVSRSAAILSILVLWELAPRLALVERAFLPPLSEVLETGWELIRNGQLASHIGASLTRSLIGF
jgi:NitT/TauT family transport system permease protein